MLLIVSASSAISPLASTANLRLRSPLATAVTTRAMPRTWPVRLAAIMFTESVKSFQVPATPSTLACPPSLPSVPTSRATRVTSEANALSWSTIVLMVSFSSRISPCTSTVTRSEEHTSELQSHSDLHSFPTRRSSDLAGNARDFGGECVELVHHRVDGVFQLEDFALHVHRD